MVDDPDVELAPHADAVPPAASVEIAAMAAEAPDIEPSSHAAALWWIGALHGDAEAMRQLARSPKLVVRRSVARAPHLPADVAALLAEDEDRGVRLFLAESCYDAPAEMLLEVASWWDGSLSFPGRPRNHPNFPLAGLMRFAEDENPRLRLLALGDPVSTSVLVDELSRDADERVRAAAAEDPRLSPKRALELVADPSWRVRERVCMNAVLPAEALLPLLLNARSAAFAVRNPGLPIATMHRMIEIAGPLVEMPA